jgi:hypothetical protein
LTCCFSLAEREIALKRVAVFTCWEMRSSFDWLALALARPAREAPTRSRSLYIFSRPPRRALLYLGVPPTQQPSKLIAMRLNWTFLLLPCLVGRTIAQSQIQCSTSQILPTVTTLVRQVDSYRVTRETFWGWITLPRPLRSP